MSMYFEDSNLTMKTNPSLNFLFMDEKEITYDDFCGMVRYFLTNTDLNNEHDPRMELVKMIKEAVAIEGYNKSGYRIQLGESYEH